MRYLIIIQLAFLLFSCESSDVQALKRENEELRLEAEHQQQAAEEAEAMALVARREAERAAEMARAAEAEALAQMKLAEKALADCKGK